MVYEMRELIKLFLPPILVRFVRLLKISKSKHSLIYSPDGWDTELSSSNKKGWDSVNAVEIERKRMDRYCNALKNTGPLGFMHEHDNPTEIRDGYHHRNITSAYVLTLASIKKEKISILDYGGSLGHNYNFAKAVLPNHIDIEFHCKEVASLVNVGKELNPYIKWYSDDSCLNRKYDLIIVNGVLQYLNEWKHLLIKIINCVDGYLFLSHLPLVNYKRGYVALQRRYGQEMLHYQFNRNEVLSQVNLCLVREFLTGIRPYIKNAPEQCELRSFLYKKGEISD